MESYEQAGKPIVFIDESGFAHDMPRRRGYAPVGRRCFGTQDWHAKGRTNVIGALLGFCLLTVSLFTGSINSCLNVNHYYHYKTICYNTLVDLKILVQQALAGSYSPARTAFAVQNRLIRTQAGQPPNNLRPAK